MTLGGPHRHVCCNTPADAEQVLAADKRRAIARLQEIEDEARIDAVRFEKDPVRCQRALDKAGDMALAREIVEGRAL